MNLNYGAIGCAQFHAEARMEYWRRYNERHREPPSLMDKLLDGRLRLARHGGSHAVLAKVFRFRVKRIWLTPKPGGGWMGFCEHEGPRDAHWQRMCIAYAGGLSDEHFYGREMNWCSGDARDIVSRARLVDPGDGLAAIEAAREATLQIVRQNGAAVRELGWALPPRQTMN